MRRFWTSVIEPIFEAVEPRVIVEIGADRGRNTVKILDYCRRTGAVAHIIDPLPKFNIEQWREEWREGVFHQGLSLEALPDVRTMDVVLIDGDHNWYTVFNELKLIEQFAEGADRFPVVLLHDVEWPYGRRDSYYDPTTVPASYRHVSAKLGLRPGKSSPVKNGLNADFEHALYEGTARNGVLTALEDFVTSSNIEFHLVTVPGMHGLGVLTPVSSLQRNERLADLVSSFETKEFLIRQCREIERARIRSILRAREKRKLLKRRVQELEKQVLASTATPVAVPEPRGNR